MINCALYLVTYKKSLKVIIKKNFNPDHLAVIYRNNTDIIYLSHFDS